MSSLEPVELKSVELQSVNLGSYGDVPEETVQQKSRRRKLKGLRELIRHKEFDPNPGKIRMCGVKCNFGTDDFFFLSLFALAVRASW